MKKADDDVKELSNKQIAADERIAELVAKTIAVSQSKMENKTKHVNLDKGVETKTKSAGVAREKQNHLFKQNGNEYERFRFNQQRISELLVRDDVAAKELDQVQYQLR
jgi:hypothetical protein